MRKFNATWPDYLEDYFGKDSSDNVWFPKAALNNPAVNIIEAKDEFFIELAVPGFDKEDFKIDLQNNVLTIGTKKEHSLKDSDKRYSKREFVFGPFEKTFVLPKSIDGEKIEASYKNGILEISIPKREEAKVKEPKAIEIK